MTYSMTLRSAASEYNIDLKTAFRWRHRFLEVINNDQAEELCGITELDETFFRESFKGQRDGLPRPSRKRGNDPNKARKVSVLVARDRERHTVDGVLENESANELCRHLNGRISIEATVCADAHLAHEKLAEKLGFEFKELVTSAGQHVLVLHFSEFETKGNLTDQMIFIHLIQAQYSYSTTLVLQFL